MFSNLRQKYVKTYEECLHEITQLITDYESHIILGKLKLCLTPDFLSYFERRVKDEPITEDDDKIVVIEPHVAIVQSLFRRVTSIKIVGTRGSNELTIGLSLFSLLNELELHNISLDSIIDLDALRSQIKSLALYRCPNSKLFTGVLQPDAWPLLKQLTLCRSGLTSVPTKLLPKSLKYLDLSWNSLTEFSFTNLSHISTLDLSFNCLKTIPKFNANDIITTSLKSLYLRGNMIEHLDGLDLIKSLTELDASFNCIYSKTKLLSVLSLCESLETLSLQSNPVSCDSELNTSVIFALPRLTTFDNEYVDRSKTPQELSRFDVNREHSLNIQESEAHVPTAEEPVAVMTDTQPLLSECTENIAKAKKKKKQKRVAVILDKSVEEEIGNDLEKNLTLLESREEEEKEEKLEETKNVLKERKRSLGQDWLINVNEDDKPPHTPPPTPNPMETSAQFSPMNSLKITLSPPLPASPVLPRKTSEDEANVKGKEDDIEILHEDKQLSEMVWTEDDVDNDDNMFLVERKYGDTDSATVFLFVKNGIITEKNCLTGKNLNNFDLSVITSAEYTNDDNLTLKMNFDSRILAKQEVMYTFENEDVLKEFKQTYLLPCILKRKEELFLKQKFYECLKCGLNKLSENILQKCPKCGSEAFMEVENEVREKRRSESDITVLNRFNHSSSLPFAQPSKDEESCDYRDVWEELCANQQNYIESDFCYIDHQLKLLLEVKVFEDKEEFRSVFKCNIVCNRSNDSTNALLIISNQKVYLFSQTNDEINEEPIFSKPLSFLRFMKPLLSQGMWVEWTEDINENEKSKKKKKSRGKINNVIIVFDDPKIFEIFLEHLSKIGIFIEEDSNNQETHDNFVKSANLPESGSPLFISRSDSGMLLLCKADFHKSDIRFIILDEQMVNDIVAPVCVSYDFKTFTLDFQNEYNNIVSHWVISVNSVNCMHSILLGIKKEWEDAYAIPLLFTKLKEVTDT
ncbi:serine/threonine-protein kinase 11-interacting protein-like isoform X1 [Leptotrombidium deliense]|uniref:Serine/threonine-protein kinase 11-interacting protein-like isoform X1 n=1 Tax=Leptotrombidium deliense TaxID=299467 RepID=A0A443SWK8_9ACAR|nr:serine/threonine-protein kinase 11-interacting protein-like isoform X1 [Leptotrombidium deliense]